MNKKVVIIITVILIILTATLWSREKKKLTERNNENKEKEGNESNLEAQKQYQKLSVLPHKCVGCGRCTRIDPEHFEMQGQKSTVIFSENLNSPSLQSAIKGCPAGAIILE